MYMDTKLFQTRGTATVKDRSPRLVQVLGTLHVDDGWSSPLGESVCRV